MNAQPAPARIAVALAVLAACVLALSVAPARAAAAAMDPVRIEATVNPDGSLDVVETRTFEFDDDVNGVFWEIARTVNAQGVPSSVEVGSVTVSDARGERAFTRAESASEGDDGVFTVQASDEDTQLKVFAPEEDGDTAEVRVAYTIDGMVTSWSDTAELYWKFVGQGWEDSSYNVELTVSFAGAAASGVAADDGNFRTWVHGPLDGRVDRFPDTAEVTCSAPEVASGTFAEIRVAFPTSWVPGLAASGEARLDTILDEEQAWADEANALRARSRAVLAVGGVAQVALPAILLAAMVALKLTRGRNPKPVFTETYFRDLPSADHPAVISAFMGGGSVPDRALVATLMKLTDERAVALDPVTSESSGLFGTKKEQDFRLSVIDRSRVAEAIDRAALRIYFDESPEAPQEVLFSQMKDRAEDDPEAYRKHLEDYRAEVSGALESRMLVASSGDGVKAAAIGIGGALALASLIFFIAVDFACLPTFAVSLILIGAAVAVACTYRVYS